MTTTWRKMIQRRRKTNRQPLAARRRHRRLLSKPLEDRRLLAGLELGWARQFGTPALERAVGVAVEDNGSAYIAGSTADALSGQTSAGGRDAYVRKYDNAGDAVWTRQFGSGGTDFAFDIAADTRGALYVGGLTTGTLSGQSSAGGVDAFVHKYESDGDLRWTRQFGTGGSDWIQGSAIDAGNLYVSGIVGGALPGQISAGSSDAYLRKYDSDGNEVWTVQFGTASLDVASGIAVHETGVYVSGQVLSALPGETSAGSRDAFVRKYDLNGAELWIDQFGSLGSDHAIEIAVDDTGVYAAGSIDVRLSGPGVVSHSDTFVRKYDEAGHEQWTRQFGTEELEFVGGLELDETGAYVAGSTEGALPGETNAGGRDSFVRKYDTDGHEVFTHQFGTSEFDSGRHIAMDDRGTVYVAGSTGGALLGQEHSGDFDAYLVKLSRPPQDQIDEGIDRVQRLVDEGAPNQGQGNSLIDELQAASSSPVRGSETAAIHQLGAFVQHVEGLIDGGVLTEEQGQPLVLLARQTIANLSDNDSSAGAPAAAVADRERSSAPAGRLDKSSLRHEVFGSNLLDDLLDELPWPVRDS